MVADAQTVSDSAPVTRRGRLVVLAGPSAVGKSTVVRLLRSRVPDLYFSVSATTRDPRPGEVDGEDYHFVGRDEFDRMLTRFYALSRLSSQGAPDDEFRAELAEIHGARP